MTQDCKSVGGITTGLIDSLMFIASIINQRDLNDPEVKEALKDLKADKDLKKLLE